MRGKLSANLCEYKGKSLASVGVDGHSECVTLRESMCVCTGRCYGVSFSVWTGIWMLCVSGLRAEFFFACMGCGDSSFFLTDNLQK